MSPTGATGNMPARLTEKNCCALAPRQGVDPAPMRNIFSTRSRISKKSGSRIRRWNGWRRICASVVRRHAQKPLAKCCDFRPLFARGRVDEVIGERFRPEDIEQLDQAPFR